MEKWTRAFYQPNLPLGENGEKVTGSKKHIMLSKDAAKEGMVLLKNDGGLLPFAKGTRLALFGKATIDYVKGGGGSGDVTVAYVRNLYEGLKLQKGEIDIFEPLCDYYKKEVERQYAEGKEPGMTTEPEVPAELLMQAKAYTDTAVISICRFSGEGWDRKDDFCLTKEEQEMVSVVKENFPKIAVVLNVGGMVDTSWFYEEDAVSSVLLAWQGGMEGGLAAAELLVGKGNPSGKLTDTFAKTLEDYPSTEDFMESPDYVNYTEDIYVGYRYFETIPGAAEKVNYPFGYGLSYTAFDVDVISAGEENGTVRVAVNVTNIGDRAGKEVVQVYFGAPSGKLGKPAKQLIAFKKTRELKPGETQVVFFSFSVGAMASYDDLGKVQRAAYVLEKGTYLFYVGTCVRNAEVLGFTYEAEEDRVVKQLVNRLVPSSLKKRMLSDGSFEALPQTEPNDPNADELERMPNKMIEGVTPAVKARAGYHLWGEPENPDRHLFMEVAEGKIGVEEFLA